MTKENLLEHTFSKAELLALQSFIGQEMEAVYVHKANDRFYYQSESIMEVCFKPQLLVKCSNEYYIFTNNIISDRLNEEVCKIAFSKYSDIEKQIQESYDKMFDLSLYVSKIEVYSTLDQMFGLDGSSFFNIDTWKHRREKNGLYSFISDSLIIMEDSIGKKVAIEASGFFQGSVKCFYETMFVETKLLPRTFGDHITPMFHKRIELSRDRISYLWQP